MKKLYQSIALTLFSIFLFVPITEVSAQTCTSVGSCDAGCGPGRRCVSPTTCITDPSCNPPGCSVVGACGPAAGCSPGSRCQPNGTCAADMGCDPAATPTVPPINLPSVDVPELNAEGLIGIIYAIGFPLALGFGMYYIIKAGYAIKLSEGSPQKFAEAKEDLTAAIIGVLFILLSVGILRVIISTFIGPL